MSEKNNWEFSKGNYELLLKGIDEIKAEMRERTDSLKEEFKVQVAEIKATEYGLDQRIGKLEQWKNRLAGAWGAVTAFVLYLYGKVPK